jgi:hypothetical protein
MKTFRLLLALSTVAASAVAVAGPVAAATPAAVARSRPAVPCVVFGAFRHGLTITSSCTVPKGRQLAVRGSLTLASGAQLKISDAATVSVRGRVVLGNRSRVNAITASTVSIRGNVLLSRDSTLALGCSAALMQPPLKICTGLSHDVVRGNILAWTARSLLIDGVTIRGNVISVGGGHPVTGPGAATCVESPNALNFVFKDNVVTGEVVVTGWQGCWIGFIRNVQHGNMIVAGNRSADPDSTEVVTNTIWGNLACFANTPAAQIGDSHGMKNRVFGVKLGECAAL